MTENTFQKHRSDMSPLMLTYDLVWSGINVRVIVVGLSADGHEGGTDQRKQTSPQHEAANRGDAE